MASSNIQIKILGDASDAKRAFKETGDAVDKLGTESSNKLGNFAKAVGGAFAAASVISFGKSALDAGSDLNETISKSNTVFGENGKAIEQWASGAAKSMGQSKQEALDAASTFGNLFVQLGTGSKEAAGMSQEMVGLASDFASFHNAAPTDVIEAMTAAFRGEYDAVQKYVPTISAATVEQKALAMSGKKTTKELTAQDKALATQALLLSGAGDAAGDFARTSDGAANKQRILSAQIKDAQAQLGTALLPAYQKVLGFILETVIPGFKDLTQWMKEHKEIVIAVGAVIGTVLVGAFIAWAAAAASAAVATLAATWPIIAITAGIAALVAGVIYAYKEWDWFRAAVDKVADAGLWLFENVLKPLGKWFMDTFVPFLTQKVIPAVVSIGETFVDIGSDIWGFLTTVWSIGGQVVSYIKELPDKITSAASGMWDGIKDSFKGVLNTIIGWWNNLQFPTFKLPEVDLGPLGSIGGGSFGGWRMPQIPTFDTGGVVDGPRGSAQLIMAHGGETVLPTHKQNYQAGGGNTYVLNVTAPVGSSAKDIGKEILTYIKAADRAGIR